MKEQAIQKINKIGKISNVITRIAKILIGSALVCTIAAAIICFMLPESLTAITLAQVMDVDVDLESLDVSMTDEEKIAAMASLEDSLVEDEEMTSAVVALTEKGIRMTGDMEAMTFTIRDGAWAVVVASVMLAMTFVTLWFVGALCKAFSNCRSPFEENVIKRMQNVAFSLIPWCIVSSVGDSVFNSIVNGKPNFSLAIDMGVVLIVLVVFVLVYIFKYGAVLQQESDETL